MTDRLELPRHYREQLEVLLRAHVPGVEVWAYGSRVSGENHDGSDLDLVLRGPALEPLDGGLYDLLEAIEKSNIPILIQAHDWVMLPESFHREIERDYVVVQEGADQRTASEWRRVTLGELSHRITKGTTPTTIGGRFTDTGIAFVKVESITNEGRIDTAKLAHINDEANDLLARSSLQKGDVLFTIAGTIGRVARVRGDILPANTNQAVAIVRPNQNIVDSEFLYYSLRDDARIERAHTRVVQSVQANFSLSELSAVEIPLPPLPEQRAIAHVLGTLDDKIELNRRMNQTLEAMARALFKSWFVDFDPVRAKMDGHWRDGESLPGLPAEYYDLFPDRLVDSELGDVPEGWEVERIEDIAEQVAMGPFGSSIKVSTFVAEGIPVISGQHLNGTFLNDGDYRFITEEHAEKLAKANVKRGDVIFTHAGNIGQVACIPQISQFERYVISQRQFYMRCDISQISPFFVVHFFKTSEGQRQLLANTSSTGVPSISRPVTYLRSIKLCIPPKPLWYQFHEIVAGLHLKDRWNTAESRTLATQRDALLSKLVSGDVRVGEVV